MKQTVIITANQRIQQWQAILNQTNPKNLPITHHHHHYPPLNTSAACHDRTNNTNTSTTNPQSHQNQEDHHDDPFDCSNLMIPETKELVKKTLKKYIEEWRDLDSRMVGVVVDVASEEGGNGGRRSISTSTMTTWENDRHHTLTDGDMMDLSLGDSPHDVDRVDTAVGRKRKRTSWIQDDDDDDDEDDPFMQSTVAVAATATAAAAAGGGGTTHKKGHYNPTGHHRIRIRLPDFFDYESKGPPPQDSSSQSVQQQQQQQQQQKRKVISLEDPSQMLDYEVELWKIFQKVPLEENIENEAIEGSILCTHHLLNLKQEIDEGLREYSRLDGHALSRLRKKDLHHWPTTVRDVAANVRGVMGRKEEKNLEVDCATIKLEFWRRHVKRFGSDPNKCEMEFLSTQTLLEVHCAIVDCMQDRLFEKGLEQQEYSRRKLHLCNNDHNDDECENDSNGDAMPSSSGYFFVEGTFYSTGEVDYVAPVMSWLSQKKRGGNDRKSFLNISDKELSQKRMDQVQLGDVPMRLGVRYVHVCHGDVETSVFLSDVTMRLKDDDHNRYYYLAQKSQYPLLHDIWTTSTSSLVHGVGVCEGCHHCPAVVITIEDELADGGPTPFCRTCFEKLHYHDHSHGHGQNDQTVEDAGSEQPCALSSTSDRTASTRLRYNNFKVVPMSVLDNCIGLSVGHDSTNALF